MGHFRQLMQGKRIAVATAFELQHNIEIASELHQLKAIDLYYNLIGGLYGEVRDIGGGEMEIEVRASESRTGYPLLFTFKEA
jgi:hypothetical protein